MAKTFERITGTGIPMDADWCRYCGFHESLHDDAQHTCLHAVEQYGKRAGYTDAGLSAFVEYQRLTRNL